ncbi:MAG TPA: PGPGW domain-containing protein [Nitrosomonas mobilis]|nr:PGPGW domain-containing protein [Nitrosomonas mobilis]
MIDQIIQFAESWVPQETWIGMITFSFIFFIGTLIAIPALLIRMPPDYFNHNGKRKWFANNHPIIRIIGLMLKNGLGLIFLMAGIAMLVLPGQGLLSMLLGILFLDFPGKHRVEQKLIQQPQILNTINAMRKKYGKPPFVFHDKTPT